jgi:hypothetical protein
MAKKANKSDDNRSRGSVTTLDEFDAKYLPAVPHKNNAGAIAEGQIGIGLVSGVLRDFRRDLRA